VNKVKKKCNPSSRFIQFASFLLAGIILDNCDKFTVEDYLSLWPESFKILDLHAAMKIRALLGFGFFERELKSLPQHKKDVALNIKAKYIKCLMKLSQVRY